VRDRIKTFAEIAKLEVGIFTKKAIEKAWWSLAFAIPRKLVYFATIRAGGYATTGKYGSDSPNDVDIMEVLKRWEST
jgi:hypothetical protein